MKIAPQDSARLSALVIAGVEASGLSREQVVRKARRLIRERAKAPRATPEEAAAWSSVFISREGLRTLENCPRNPLADPRRRAYMLAFSLALDLDLAQVNRFAGGVW